VPHTGADGQKYTSMIENGQGNLSNEALQQALNNLRNGSEDGQAFQESYERLQLRGERVANITNKLLAVADRVSREKALRALISSSTASTASSASTTSATTSTASTTNTPVPNLHMHRSGSVTVNMAPPGNQSSTTTTNILADISAATRQSRTTRTTTTSRRGQEASHLNINTTAAATRRVLTSNKVDDVMSPSTWGKLQGISATGEGSIRNKATGSRTQQRESPTALMAELSRVNLGRAPERDGTSNDLNSSRSSRAAAGGNGNLSSMSPSDHRRRPFHTLQQQQPSSRSRERTDLIGGGRNSSSSSSNMNYVGPVSMGDGENSPVSLRFGQKVVLRSAGQGGYLTATGRSLPMVLSEGGSLTELTLVNGNFRDDVGTVRYGDVVSFHVHHIGRDQAVTSGVLAASATDGAVCVATALGGTEKWVIVAPSDSAAGASSSSSSSSSSISSSSSSAALTTLRSSDPILLRANSLGGRYLNGDMQLKEVAPLSTSSWYLVHSHTPYVPAWNRTRPYLTSHYIDRGFTETAVNQLPTNSPTRVRWLKDRSKPLKHFSVAVQENFLMEDLLSAMLGVGGRYIRASVEDSLFAMDIQLVNEADPSVVFLASRVLPACGHYVRVSTYIESRSQYQYGLTVHALCASMRSLVQEYTILVAQLEHQFRNGQLSLQKLFFYTQPALRTLAALDDVVYSVGYRIGGDLLNVIDRLRSECGGDRKVHALYSYLLSTSSVPTFNMLTRWVHYGDVNDQYSEFMITVNQDQSRADLLADFNTKYWASRYTVRGEMVPIFLQRAAEKILTTGKYLNVLRGCGVVGEKRLKDTRKLWLVNEKKKHYATNGSSTNGAAVVEPSISAGAAVDEEDDLSKWSEKRKLQYDNGERSNIDSIENAYHFSSKALLDLLLKDHQLLPRLRSLKHYFLVDQGDFFVHFMDAAEEELRRSTADISSVRLEFLLESSVRQSISEHDIYRTDLKCSLLPYTLIQHLELVQQLSGEEGSGSGEGGGGGNVLSSSRFQGMDSIEDTRRKLLLVRRNQQLKGMEAFALDYEISWPLSIVISRKELTKYQLIFRHLFFCNHVKRQLSKTWLSHQTLKELDLRQMLAPTYTLRHRMLHFIQNLLYYMMVEVLEPRHHELEQNIQTTSTVDEVLLHHSEFLGMSGWSWWWKSWW